MPRFASLSLLLTTLLAPIGCMSPRANGVEDLRVAARIATDSEDWTAAAELWHEVLLEEGGMTSEPYLQTARALGALGACDDARAVLDNGLARHPDDSSLLAQRALLYCQAGFHRAAERDLQTAVRQEPKRGELWYELGRVRLRLDLPVQAADALGRALENGMSGPEVFALRAVALRRTGELAAAADHYREALRMDPDPSLERMVEAASIYADQELCDADASGVDWARSCLERVVEQDPQYADAYYYLGLVHAHQGEDEQAIACLSRAVEVDNFHVPCLTKLALLYEGCGRRESARAMAERALALEIDPSRARALREVLGDLLIAEGADEGPPPATRD